MLSQVAADTSQFVGLAVAVAFALAVAFVPGIARARSLLFATLLAALCYYQREFAGFLLVSGVAYLVLGRLSREVDHARRWRLACLAIIVLAVVFTLGRVEHWNRAFVFPLAGPLAVYSLGMWPMLKLVTLFWEIGSGTAVAPSFSQYVIWTCLPFTLAGPVLRWSQMPGEIVAEPKVFRTAAWWREAVAATAKLLTGIYLGVAASFLAAHWHSHYGNNAVTTFVSGPLGFYLTYAGYFQWMELLGRSCGVSIPESFSYPIGRENISAFWMNWNMTATFVFRDYLFYNRWGRGSYNIYFNTILLFTLVGLWHAANGYWVLWGFLHGLLFCAYLVWRKHGQRAQIPLRGTRASAAGARLFTYFCVCMCWYLPSKILQKVAAI